MPENYSEWSRPGLGGRWRERYTRHALPTPLVVSVALITIFRLLAGNAVGSKELLQDTGRSLSVSIQYQTSLLSIIGHPRCREVVRQDIGSHHAVIRNVQVINVASTPADLVWSLRVWSGSSHRASIEDLRLPAKGSIQDFSLLSPPSDSLHPNVRDLRPVSPGITKCELAIWLLPAVSTTPPAAPTSPCLEAARGLEQESLGLLDTDLENNSVGRCATPQDWMASVRVVLADPGFIGVSQNASTSDLQRLLFHWCIDPDRALSSTSLCRTLIDQSNKQAARLA
ncbi:MAG: hypothetical protein ACXVQY_11045 [Actinomycetota bacterium]